MYVVWSFVSFFLHGILFHVFLFFSDVDTRPLAEIDGGTFFFRRGHATRMEANNRSLSTTRYTRDIYLNTRTYLERERMTDELCRNKFEIDGSDRAG